MPRSVQKTYSGPFWPLGFVQVANNGTPVNVMVNVDSGNVNSPSTPANGTNLEYTPTCHKVFFQGYKPASSNNGMVVNDGPVYITVAPAGNGSGGRADSGSMLFVLTPGGGVTLPGSESQLNTLSPYQFWIDADVDGDGAIVTLQS